MGVSCRANDLPPFIVMDVLARATQLAAQGVDIIHLEVGEPDLGTPKCISEAGIKAIQEGRTQYTQAQGILELREAVALDYTKLYGVEVDPERVVITAGTSPALLLLFAALLEPEQEVIISDPAYACYDNFINFLGGCVVRVPVREEEGFQYRPAEIGAAMGPNTKAIMINSPANPTGQLLSADRMAAIAELAPGKPGGPYIISDEIYHGLVYEGKDHSILEFTDNAFVLNGFSKFYAMTGWRLGYVIAPPNYLRPLQKMHQNFAICAPTMSQYAAVTALQEARPDAEAMVARYAERRRAIVDGLRELGFSIPVEPNGAFYVMTRCDHLDPDDYKLAFDILEKTGVAIAPGRDFGPGGHGYLRFSYCNSLKNIKEGLARLGEYIKQYYPDS